ncbi:hypothetical protein V502_10615 [Pseudogymnoascus sp. VKM F-4520 (FW-2644)]|nr:hypothetical protein V502_10615 [Pseudogymnoascus sp. VKM F-4520 (FW-2644)]
MMSFALDNSSPKMKWLPFSSHNANPEYHLASDDDVRAALAQWKRRCYVLAAAYTLTVLVGVGYILRSRSAAGGMLRSEAFFGDIPRELVTFKPNQTFVDTVRGTARNRTVWDELFPLGGGFVAVQNPASYGLTGGLPVLDAEGLVVETYYNSQTSPQHAQQRPPQARVGARPPRPLLRLSAAGNHVCGRHDARERAETVFRPSTSTLGG